MLWDDVLHCYAMRQLPAFFWSQQYAPEPYWTDVLAFFALPGYPAHTLTGGTIEPVHQYHAAVVRRKQMGYKSSRVSRCLLRMAIHRLRVLNYILTDVAD